jgi:hypothetical protein
VGAEAVALEKNRMAQGGAKKTEFDLAQVTEVTTYAPGGSLAAYVDHLRSLGQTALMSADRSYAWVIAERGLLQRTPLEFTDEANREEVHRLLRLPGIWLVTYLREPDAAHPANAFHYFCGGPDYEIEALDWHARRDIRYGLRNYRVRLCTFDEAAEKGYAAAVDTSERHGQPAPPREQLRRYAEVHRGLPFFDVWGAWKDSELAAWMAVARIDDHATIISVRSRTGAKACPNNAVLYAATRKYLVEDKCRYVTYGLSTIRSKSNIRSLHEYKERMGYKPVPIHRVFVPRTVLSPLLRTKVGSWGLDAAAMISKMSRLQQAAGLSRVMSGREKAPLAWAERAAPGAEGD